jgi:pimeloyl-ACP methyl ester carboxylesterase
MMGAAVAESEVTVAGVRSRLLQARESDASEAVVFLHGNPGSSEDWRDLLGRVGDFARGVAFDLPGFGRADKPRDFDYTIEGYAAFTGATLNELGVARAHLVLHDFGGPFGICWAAANPDRLASAVLINTATGTARRWHRMARLWRRPLVGELTMAATTRRRWTRGFSAEGQPRLPPEFVDRMYDDFDRGTRRAVLRLYRATDLPYPPAGKWVETLAGLDRPALIVWGKRDPFVSRRRGEELRRAFPSAEIAELPESGHFPFADDPEGTASAVIPFLRRQL